MDLFPFPVIVNTRTDNCSEEALEAIKNIESSTPREALFRECDDSFFFYRIS